MLSVAAAVPGTPAYFLLRSCAAAQQRSTTTTALVFYDAQHCSCRADYDSYYCLLIQSTSLASPECKARDGGEVIVTYSASAQGYASALWWNRAKHARQSSAAQRRPLAQEAGHCWSNYHAESGKHVLSLASLWCRSRSSAA